MPDTRHPTPDPLSKYRAKRSADRTPEPGGAAVTPVAEAGGLFVVHKHAARRLHFDLRLEMEGVLRSWAVPRGPSANPADKRLAVHVEDHPIEYGDFEGIIPEGNYGAGAVIVWDRGVWVPLDNPLEGLKTGKLLFDLRGYKLRGRWTLVKIKSRSQARENTGKEWLLIKERDGFVSPDGDAYPQQSVLSGLTVEDLREGRDAAGPVKKRLARLKAPKRHVVVEELTPMLAETREEPFSRPGWVFELKYDGYRILAARAGGEGKLISRNGNDLTGTFPEIARAVKALPFDDIVLDGEVAVVGEDGHPSFDRLQKRGRLTRAAEVRRAAVEHPATYFVFDLLGFEGYDLRTLPLRERKALLQQVLPGTGPLKYTDHIEEHGEAFYQELLKMRLEGMVAKRADSPYKSIRSSDWIKVRADRTDDFVVVGYTSPKGMRTGFGALQVADYVDDTLTYAGRVGTGFTADQLETVRGALEKGQRGDPPCVGPIQGAKETTWVEPVLVCEVRYKERTEQGLLRHPVFLRFRDDKRPEECVRQVSGERGTGNGKTGLSAGAPSPEQTVPRSPFPDPREVRLSNLDKIFWPAEGYTKGDLIAYYRAISPWLLPYLKDRPVVMTRFPDGIDGKSFFQKDAPGFAPEWIRRERMWSGASQRELDYFICDSEAALTYIINLGTIPLHIWASRLGSLEQPDWCILDLDPKEAPFKDVITVALAIRELSEQIELPTFIKTSGSTGLHVLIPLARQLTYEQSRTLGHLLARVVAAGLRDIATITRNPSKREGKVYLDYVQNGHGRLLVAPFSARPVPGASVSMPLDWDDVSAKLDLKTFTIKSAVKRMQKLKDDPMAGVLTEQPDLRGALARLQEKLDETT